MPPRGPMAQPRSSRVRQNPPWTRRPGWSRAPGPGAVADADSSCRVSPACFPPRSSFPRLLEVSQIGWRLILLGGHQEAISAQEIVFRADDDLVVALGAESLAPVRMRIGVAPKGLVDAPGPRQGVVEHGDLVMKEVRIIL